jgi:predicted nucleic acid-binding protein
VRILLDTNIVIHREASTVVKKDIGVLFNWLDRLHYEKCVHPLTIAEIRKHKDRRVVDTFNAKIQSYTELKTEAPESPAIQQIRSSDQSENDRNDTSVVKEVYENRVDFLITEDRGIHAKARNLRVSHRVFTIDDFLEKVTSENPELADYKVLSVEKALFGNVRLADSFFESFREDYIGFAEWFNKKADQSAYACKSESGDLLAFLFLKLEDHREAYPDIVPGFSPKRRLKIGTFKVTLNGFKLGERFLKIVFDNALRLSVDEIYVTIFDKRPDQARLILLLEDWGFRRHGVKTSTSGEEIVLVRDFTSQVNVNFPRLTFPYMSGRSRKFIVAIYPKYHTELLPDSILRTESVEEFVDNKPNRNAIRKVYISRSIRRDMARGDIVVFYRTAEAGRAAHHTSVATTLGLIEAVVEGIANLEEFVRLCRKRSVFTDAELKEYWDYNPRSRPFVVNFLYTYSLPKRPNLATLKEQNIITEAPRGFDLLSDTAFSKLMEISNADQRLIIY